MTKLSHREVKYGPGHPRGDHCAVCEHFQKTGPHCAIVADPIQAMGWCEKFEEKGEQPKGSRLSQMY